MLRPEKVIRKKVSPVEVGKYYLKAELGGIFPGSEETRKTIDGAVDALDDHNFWRLLEALSFSYRLNYVFWSISNTSFSWSEEQWLAANLTLTGMNPAINSITFSPEINQNPIKFRDYLIKYFEKHPSNDPQKLGEFRPDNRTVKYPKIILREEDEKILLLDGSARLIKFLLEGQKQVIAFVARKTGQEDMFRVGDSTFLLLRNLYVNSNPEEKGAILRTVERLMNISTDGYTAVKNYWVDHARDDNLRKIGESLLEKISLKKNKTSLRC